MTDENNQQYRGRGRIIDAGGPTFREPLRRPGMNNECASSTQPSTSSRFTLSADAPEFIPKSASYRTPPESAPAYAPETAVNGEQEFGCLDDVRAIVYELSVDPGQFDTLARHLCATLNTSITDEPTLINVVNEIFEPAMVDSNFRYNGSRLCNYLSNHLTVKFNDQQFRSHLLNRCKQEFEKRDVYASTVDGRVKLRDFAMLLGELFVHLEIVNKGVHTKIQKLGSTLPDLLDTLLKRSTADDVKIVCQILKFTGAALEDLGDKATKLNELFEVMKALTLQENFERRMKDMLSNVIQLRESNWGRGTPTQLMENLHLSNPVPTNEPVFYGPDGQPLSSEEARFLESDKYLYEQPDDDYSSGDYANHASQLWSSADGMDDEMADDYEKFLLENS